MGQVIWSPTDPPLVEQKESNAWEFGDLVTVTKVYRGQFADCLSAAPPKGTIGTGALAGYVVMSAKVARERHGVGVLTVIWQSATGSLPGGGAQLPADEFDLDPFELNPRLEKNYRYSSLTEAERSNVKIAYEGPTDKDRDQARTKISSIPAALELLQKLKAGIESFYLAGFTYRYTFHSWMLPAITVGGYIEAPGGPLSGSFSGLSCLRAADKLAFTGSLFKVTRTWLCAPAGHWDTDIY